MSRPPSREAPLKLRSVGHHCKRDIAFLFPRFQRNTIAVTKISTPTEGVRYRAPIATSRQTGPCGIKVSQALADQLPRRSVETIVMAEAFTVLLVDDDDLVRGPLVHLLSTYGVRVLTAASAIEAMRVLGQERVDVLFTDIVMPDQDGIELARQAQQVQPGIRLMFATGYFSRAATAAQLGKLLFKPLRASEIEAALKDVLGDKSLPEGESR